MIDKNELLRAKSIVQNVESGLSAAEEGANCYLKNILLNIEILLADDY